MRSDKNSEFKEIGHCGGQFTVNVKTTPEGRRTFQVGTTHSRPTAAAFVGVYANLQGDPVGMIQLGGIGQPFNEPPGRPSVPVFLASDSEGKFGHRCPSCQGYWRSAGPTASWPGTCAYCGVRRGAHAFLTSGQKRFISACVALIHEALAKPEDGESVIDMDQVADAINQKGKVPKFYYAEQRQQKRFNCTDCGAFNDILGRFAYCSCCGTHNGITELDSELLSVQETLRSGKYENAVKEAVAAFDGFARQLARQLADRSQLSEKKKKAWKKRLFHQLKPCADELKSDFQISLFNGVNEDDLAFAVRMFQRRHLYEHNGGEVDERYIRESGDTSVKVKQRIYETSESSTKTIELVRVFARNLHTDFHRLFPPEKEPIELQARRVRMRSE